MTIADLYQEFEGKLRRYAMGLAQNADRADDLVQETFIRAWSHLALLELLNPYQRRSWLYQVLKNLFLDQQRASQRAQALVEQITREAQSAESLAPEVWSPGLLQLVPERYHRVLHQRYVLGMTSEEIARELGVPAATVRSRLHLAIQWLRVHRSEVL